MLNARRWHGIASLLLACGLVIATATTSLDATGGLKVSEVHGVKTRSGRQLQQTFGSSSIVPLVIDDSPCVSFNADDASPVLDSDGNIVGYTTVHSNNYDTDGLSILRLDVVILNFEINYYFGSVNGSDADTNIRATLSTGLPNGCPSNTTSHLTYSKGIAVDCGKRRATLDLSVPTSLFNCTTATTEDFSIVFFLQLSLDLAPEQCAASRTPFWAGGIYNAIPYGSGCSYVMVTAACKPSTCYVDAGSLDEQQQLQTALGSTGRIAGARVQRANSAYDTGLSNLNAAVVGGLVGGVLLAAAVVVGYVLFTRRGAAAAAAASHHVRRSSSVASDYLDADRYDSFTIDTASVAAAGRQQREARRMSRLSSAQLSVSRPSVLRAMGAGRWRDKFGVAAPSASPAGPAAGSEAAAAASSAAGDASVADGNQFLLHGHGPYTPAPGGGAASAGGAPSHGGSMSTAASPFAASTSRLPSMFFSSPRGPSVFAQPRNASMVGMPVIPTAPSISLGHGHGRSGPSASRARRSSTLVTAPTVPMVLDRAAASNLAGVAAPTDGVSVPAELAPPDDASSVFLNPLALLRGGKGKDHSGSSSPRMLSMSTLASAFTAFGTSAMRRSSVMEDRSDRPFIRMVVEEEAVRGGGGGQEGMPRPLSGAAALDGIEGGPLALPRTQPAINRRGGGGGSAGGGRPGPVAEATEYAAAGAGEDAARVTDMARWPGRIGEGLGQSGVRARRPSPSTSIAGSDMTQAAYAEPPRGLAGGSLRSILPRPPPLILPAPVDAAAVAAASPSARMSRPLPDTRAALASSSRASLQSLQSQASSRSMQARYPSGAGDS